LVKLKLDLHDIYDCGDEIDRALRSVMDEAVAKKASLVEIIPGKGSGQLRKRGTSLSRPQGHQDHLPPSGEGSAQLWAAVRPLPVEIAPQQPNAYVA
jgi:Smr domain-containing protein